jgi:hypothetical protein
VPFGFTSHPKKNVLRIFKALKNPSPSAVFEPTNLRSSGKHGKNYITEATFGIYETRNTVVGEPY